MKPILLSLFPLLLAACALDTPSTKVETARSETVAATAEPLAAPNVAQGPATTPPAEPPPKVALTSQEAPKTATPAQAPAQAPAAPSPAPSTAPTTKVTPADPHAGHEHQATTQTELPGGNAQVEPLGPPKTSVQMPVVPPTPTPVVPIPPFQADPHAFSGTNLGGPMQIHGKTVDENELRRFLCYGIGSKQVDSLKFELLANQELARRVAAGQDPALYAVTDEELDRNLDRQRKDFLLKYPSLDFPSEVGRAFLSLDVYRNELRRTLAFDKLFFPEDPRNWPPITTEAIISQSGGRDFVDDAIESYDARKKMMDEQGLAELPQDDPIFVDSLRAWLLEELNKFAEIVMDPARLPADMLLMVDGQPVKVEQVWSVIGPLVTWDQVADARRFVALTKVAEHDLTQRGLLMSQEEFEKTFMPGYDYKVALSAFEMVALVLQGFPSIQASAHYERLQRSYRKLIAEELASDEQLRPYLQRANQIAGAAKIDAEVILSSAYDYPNARWTPDGWKRAQAKATELKAKLDAGADWGDTLELHSDFWDPPMPEVGQTPQFTRNYKGRFGAQTRNQFTGDLQESDYTTLLTGRCIADKIFFEQPVGTISEVLEGPRGYYIARVLARTPATAALNLQVPVNREFLVNFVGMQRFGAYARQLLTDAIAKREVTGF